MIERPVEQRVTDLEDLMAQVLRTIDRVDRQIDQTQRQIDQTQRQTDQTQRQVERTSQELRASHERSEAEMREFREEMRLSRIDMNKKWGELANKMGTMAEDLVAPSVPRILRETVGCPDGQVESMAVRVRRLHPADRGRSREFDVVAACGEHVLINETKSSLNPRDMDEFAQQMAEARDFFPEYADRKFVGAIASLYVDESVARYGERRGLVVLGFGEDVMEVLNSPGFVPKPF